MPMAASNFISLSGPAALGPSVDHHFEREPSVARNAAASAWLATARWTIRGTAESRAGPAAMISYSNTSAATMIATPANCVM